MALTFSIQPLPLDLQAALQHKIDQKTKPLGALGCLEHLALQIGLVQKTLSPALRLPTLLIFAGDHGVAESGVSAYPQTVTAQMVDNFLSGGAAINVFARQNAINLFIVDAGVNADLVHHPRLIAAKIAKGTANFLNRPAMSHEQCDESVRVGAELVLQQHALGCNCIGFGEMGIANTSSAAVLVHCLANIPLTECVGRGTGLDDKQLENKTNLLQQALNFHRVPQHSMAVLATFGGFEIAMMVGAFLKAAELQMVIMVDGFIASSALLVAYKINPLVLDYCIVSHLSAEQGHGALLRYLGIKPLLSLDLRLGEGSGVALAYPILMSAVLFLNEMATFESAGVDQQTVPQ